MKALLKLVSLAGLVAASAACTHPMEGEERPEGEAAPEALELESFIVFANGSVCGERDCPRFTVLDAQQRRTSVHEVRIADGGEWHEALYGAGLRVRGHIETSDSTLVLDVDEPLSALRFASPISSASCDEESCQTTLLDSDGVVHNISQIDFRALELDAEQESTLFNEMAEGRLRVGGFLEESAFGESFVATGVPQENLDFTVREVDLHCLVPPCPDFLARASDGTDYAFHSVNLDALALDLATESSMRLQMEDDLLQLRGFVSGGGRGYVNLHVTQALETPR